MIRYAAPPPANIEERIIDSFLDHTEGQSNICQLKAGVKWSEVHSFSGSSGTDDYPGWQASMSGIRYGEYGQPETLIRVRTIMQRVAQWQPVELPVDPPQTETAVGSHSHSERCVPAPRAGIAESDDAGQHSENDLCDLAAKPKASVKPATQSGRSVLENYPGAKSNSGILQFLINRIPAHQIYAELFAGSAQLFRAKRRAAQSFITDIYPVVLEALRAKFPPRASGMERLEYECIDARKFLERWSIAPMRQAFIYLDPPYPADARRSDRALYKHEMLHEDEHRQLLELVRGVEANIMISTRQNRLYDTILHDWRKEEFSTVDRGGATIEVIYMNYPPPTLLHQYDHLGEGYIDRQRIKRKVQRFEGKIQELPPYEKHLLIQELISNDRAAVKHFLSVNDRKS